MTIRENLPDNLHEAARVVRTVVNAVSGFSNGEEYYRELLYLLSRNSSSLLDLAKTLCEHAYHERETHLLRFWFYEVELETVVSITSRYFEVTGPARRIARVADLLTIDEQNFVVSSGRHPTREYPHVSMLHCVMHYMIDHDIDPPAEAVATFGDRKWNVLLTASVSTEKVERNAALH
jgi:hypothetical protein